MTTAPIKSFTSPGIMLLSAAIFGYFGFMLAFPEIDPTTGQKIPLVVTLKWTVRGAAILFLLSALLAMVNGPVGSALYAIGGVITAVLFLAIAGWDLASPFRAGIHPFLLVVFAIWNGMGSLSALPGLRFAGSGSESRS